MQNQQQSSSKGTVIVLIIIIIITLSLFFYFKGKPTDNSISSLEVLGGQTDADSAQAKVASDKVIILLNQINALKIDGAIFKSAVYKSLVDYTVAVPEQNVGRPNPFAPVGGFQVQAPVQIIKK